MYSKPLKTKHFLWRFICDFNYTGNKHTKNSFAVHSTVHAPVFALCNKTNNKSKRSVVVHISFLYVCLHLQRINNFLYIFWEDYSVSPIPSLMPPMVFEGFLDSNPECYHSKLPRYRLSHPSLWSKFCLRSKVSSIFVLLMLHKYVSRCTVHTLWRKHQEYSVKRPKFGKGP